MKHESPMSVSNDAVAAVVGSLYTLLTGGPMFFPTPHD